MPKTTVRTFRWGTVIPMTLTFFVTIVLFFQSYMPRTALAAAAGVLLLLSGLCAAAAFFAGQPVHVTRMLAGTVQLSAGLWALITCASFYRSVLALGMGIFLLLAAVSEGFSAFEARGERPVLLVRAFLAAAYLTASVLLIVNHFSAFFPSVNASLVTAAAFMLLFCAEDLFFLLRGGFFYEETLRARPVQAEDGRAEKKD